MAFDKSGIPVCNYPPHQTEFKGRGGFILGLDLEPAVVAVTIRDAQGFPRAVANFDRLKAIDALKQFLSQIGGLEDLGPCVGDFYLTSEGTRHSEQGSIFKGVHVKNLSDYPIRVKIYKGADDENQDD